MFLHEIQIRLESYKWYQNTQNIQMWYLYLCILILLPDTREYTISHIHYSCIMIHITHVSSAIQWRWYTNLNIYFQHENNTLILTYLYSYSGRKLYWIAIKFMHFPLLSHVLNTVPLLSTEWHLGFLIKIMWTDRKPDGRIDRYGQP